MVPTATPETVETAPRRRRRNRRRKALSSLARPLAVPLLAYGASRVITTFAIALAAMASRTLAALRHHRVGRALVREDRPPGYPTSVPQGDFSAGTGRQAQSSVAFFPLYPMLVRALDRVLPGGADVAGVVLSLVIGAVATVLVWIVAEKVGRPAGGRPGGRPVRLLPRRLRPVAGLRRGAADRPGGRLPAGASAAALGAGRRTGRPGHAPPGPTPPPSSWPAPGPPAWPSGSAGSGGPCRPGPRPRSGWWPSSCSSGGTPARRSSGSGSSPRGGASGSTSGWPNAKLIADFATHPFHNPNKVVLIAEHDPGRRPDGASWSGPSCPASSTSTPSAASAWCWRRTSTPGPASSSWPSRW